VLFTCTCTCLLALINLGSTVAFNAIIGLQLSALMATYSISIGCVWYQRTLGGGQHLPPAAWSLGKYGAWINGIAFVYSVQIFFWCFWPGSNNPTKETFNWAIVMFVGVFTLSLGYYMVKGRHVYTGPVALVRT
jgi:choline transport protein